RRRGAGRRARAAHGARAGGGDRRAAGRRDRHPDPARRGQPRRAHHLLPRPRRAPRALAPRRHPRSLRRRRRARRRLARGSRARPLPLRTRTGARLMLSLQEISDRLELQDLIYRYSELIDKKEFDKLADDVFTPDAFIDYSAFGGSKGHPPTTIAFLKKAMKQFRTQ